jgi:hypothetical protein
VTWRQVTKFDPRPLALANRHYSRQQPGTPQFLPPGRTVVLYARTETGEAVFAAVENMPPGRGAAKQWRVAIFRNEGAGLSSDLIREAVELTRRLWVERYGSLPSAPLTTEVDPTKTRKKRDPGRCFLRAGWRRIGERRGLIILEAA